MIFSCKTGRGGDDSRRDKFPREQISAFLNPAAPANGATCARSRTACHRPRGAFSSQSRWLECRETLLAIGSRRRAWLPASTVRVKSPKPAFASQAPADALTRWAKAESVFRRGARALRGSHGRGLIAWSNPRVGAPARGPEAPKGAERQGSEDQRQSHRIGCRPWMLDAIAGAPDRRPGPEPELRSPGNSATRCARGGRCLIFRRSEGATEALRVLRGWGLVPTEIARDRN